MVHKNLDAVIVEAIKAHKLPPSFKAVVESCYVPIAATLARLTDKNKSDEQAKTLILGIQGTQGSGKSTMASFLTLLLETQYNYRVADLSIDDFYHTYATRQQLSETVHPLLKTRGVPGTHDLTLATHVFNALLNLKEGESERLPRFNKAIDDRSCESEWPVIQGPVDIIIIEGWCVGADPQKPHELNVCVNSLEETQDSDMRWRKFVNMQLEQDYKRFFDLIDYYVVIRTPSFEQVYQWRLLQEKKLAEKVANEGLGENSLGKKSKLLNEEQLKYFISHYQRITEHCFDCMPAKANWLVELNSDHSVKAFTNNHVEIAD